MDLLSPASGTTPLCPTRLVPLPPWPCLSTCLPLVADTTLADVLDSSRAMVWGRSDDAAFPAALGWGTRTGPGARRGTRSCPARRHTCRGLPGVCPHLPALDRRTVDRATLSVH